jgi:putative addiction module antidote
MVELAVKLTKIGNSMRVTIPREIIEVMKLKEGDILRVDIKDGTIIIKK